MEEQVKSEEQVMNEEMENLKLVAEDTGMPQLNDDEEWITEEELVTTDEELITTDDEWVTTDEESIMTDEELIMTDGEEVEPSNFSIPSTTQEQEQQEQVQSHESQEEHDGSTHLGNQKEEEQEEHVDKDQSSQKMEVGNSNGSLTLEATDGEKTDGKKAKSKSPKSRKTKLTPTGKPRDKVKSTSPPKKSPSSPRENKPLMDVGSVMGVGDSNGLLTSKATDSEKTDGKKEKAKSKSPKSRKTKLTPTGKPRDKVKSTSSPKKSLSLSSPCENKPLMDVGSVMEIGDSIGLLTLEATDGEKTGDEKAKSKSPKNRKTKLTPTGRPRDKVKSTSPPKKSLSLSTPRENKPLMDLRSIIQKHEKKPEKPVIQPYEKVGFYGSLLSSVPSYFVNEPTHDPTPTWLLTTGPNTNRPVSVANRVDEIESKMMSKTGEGEEDNNISPTRARAKKSLPTPEEIVMTAEYDESQLQLWKSMSAMDGTMNDPRPQEMLPLQPGVRPSKKNLLESSLSPKASGVRAFSRPEDWINRPDIKSPIKSYQRPEMKKGTILDTSSYDDHDDDAND